MRKLVTIDCDYVHPRFACAFLMVEDDRALFVENNTTHAVPKLLQALKNEGLSPEQVEYLIITHVHLDHAGGTSALLRHCPNATVLAHPKAAKRVIDPARLVESARKVYGDAQFDALYGRIDPVDPRRVRSVEDGEVIRFGARELRFFNTLGHATHHFCIQDSGTSGVFTGDSFGLRYPALQRHGLFIFPSTSPVDFNPAEARLSYRRIVETGGERAFLTHYGEVEGMKEAESQLLLHLEAHERVLEEAKRGPLSDERLAAWCGEQLHAHFARFFERQGWNMEAKDWDLLRLDVEINGAGIAYVAQRFRRAGG